MRILIVGDTGGVGARLCRLLKKDRHEIIVISDQADAVVGQYPGDVSVLDWDGESAADWADLINSQAAIVNLTAGVWLADEGKPSGEAALRASKAVAEAILSAPEPPRLLLQASSVAYYGDCGDDMLVEESPPGESGHARCVADWEQVTTGLSVRQCCLRLGFMLDDPRLAIPQRLTAERQWIPWVHGDDVARAIRFLLQHETASGPVNLVAPRPVMATFFNHILAGGDYPQENFLSGEMILDSQRALPQKLLSWGFRFVYADIEDAVRCLTI